MASSSLFTNCGGHSILLTNQKATHDGVASLCHCAAEEAFANFSLSLELLNRDVSLLGENYWREPYDLSLTLYNGIYDRSLTLYNGICKLGNLISGDIQKVKVCQTQVSVFVRKPVFETQVSDFCSETCV